MPDRAVVTGQSRARLRRRTTLRRAASLRRGVGLIWFVGITLPVILVAFALAVDINSMVTAQDEINNLAYAAAVAGAYQFSADPSPSGGMIDPTLGPQVALSTALAGIILNTSPAATDITVEAPVLTSYGQYNDDEITVTVTYKVPNLVVLGYITGSGTSESQTLSVSRTAFVCVPGDTTGPTGGFCVTPRTQ